MQKAKKRETTQEHPLSNAVKYVLFANTILILIQYFLGQMSVLRDGLVQTLTNSSPNIAWVEEDVNIWGGHFSEIIFDCRIL
jgi:hypothetical protein